MDLAGPIEFSPVEILVIFLIVGLGPPLLLSAIAAPVHSYVRRRNGLSPDGLRIFLLWLAVSIGVWLTFLGVVGS